MTGKLSVNLGNPLFMFFWNFAMAGIGLSAGGYWHPSRAMIVTMAICAGVFAALHELVCCFLWCSVTAWWIGRNTSALTPKH
jgi:hypothetical protein